MERKRILSSIIIRNFLIGYLFVFIIPVITMVTAQKQSMAALSNNVLQGQLSLLKQTSDALDMRIQEVQKISMQVAQNTIISDHMYKNHRTGLRPYQIWECQTQLKNHIATNRYVSQAMLCLKDTRMFFSTSAYYAREDFGKKIIIEPSYPGVDVFGYHLGSIYRMKIIEGKGSIDTLVYIKSFLDGVSNDYYGNILLIFDPVNLNNLISFSPGAEYGVNMVLDQQNNTLLAVGKNPQLIQNDWSALLDPAKDTGSIRFPSSNINMNLTYYTSKPYEYKFLSIYPENTLQEQTVSLRRMMYVYLTLTIIIGGAAAMIFTMWQTQPIQMVLQALDRANKVNEKIKKASGYRALPDAVNDLVDTLAQLERQNAEHMNMKETALLLQILRGEAMDDAHLEPLTRSTGISAKDIAFAGIAFTFSGSDGQAIPVHIYAECIRAGFDGQMENPAFFLKKESDSIFVLLYFNKREKPDFQLLASRVIEHTLNLVANSKHIPLPISGILAAGISDSHSVKHIQRCISEAYFAAEHSSLFETPTPTQYKCVVPEATPPCFGIMDYQRLLSAIKSGSCSTTQNLINGHIQQLFIEGPPVLRLIEQFFNGLKSVIIEALQYIHEPELLRQAETIRIPERDYWGAFIALENLCMEVVEAINKKRTRQQSTLAGAVLAYIKAAYTDPNMSLVMVADHFGISESHLSKALKQHTDQTFAAHLEQCRMEAATQLLREGSLGINDIAEKVGYNSVESFRRAFKRVMRTPPSSYKP